MRLSFGTDGVRGIANTELTPEVTLALGRAAARVLASPVFLVGRDTRLSGPLLQSALSAGLASEGAEVVDLGVLPTPGVAALAAERGVAAAVVSASHNPFPDNGIKLFGVGGTKLDDAVEQRVEEELVATLSRSGAHDLPAGADVGRIAADPAAADRYAAVLAATLGGRSLEGLHVVLDCACGAASGVAPRVLRTLGAEVTAIATEPDGTNINDGCGSTHPETAQKAVLDLGADLGLALDGDADRVIAIDHTGALVDGDHLMAMCALDLRARGALAGDTVAVTVMTNLGFRLAMDAAGIRVHETPVGDRHVLAALEAHGWVLGGEQSGHIIFRHLSTTGDGTLTGLQVLDLVRRSGRPLAELAAEAMTAVPQLLRNVRVADPGGLREAAEVWRSVSDVERELGQRGRVLLRASGTEPVVRVMVEADDPERAEAAVSRLCAVVEEALGQRP